MYSPVVREPWPDQTCEVFDRASVLWCGTAIIISVIFGGVLVVIAHMYLEKWNSRQLFKAALECTERQVAVIHGNARSDRLPDQTPQVKPSIVTSQDTDVAPQIHVSKPFKKKAVFADKSW